MPPLSRGLAYQKPVVLSGEKSGTVPNEHRWKQMGVRGTLPSRRRAGMVEGGIACSPTRVARQSHLVTDVPPSSPARPGFQLAWWPEPDVLPSLSVWRMPPLSGYCLPSLYP